MQWMIGLYKEKNAQIGVRWLLRKYASGSSILIIVVHTTQNVKFLFIVSIKKIIPTVPTVASASSMWRWSRDGRLSNEMV